MEKSPSDEQEKALDQRGRFVLLACPGSGKTLTVAHRLAGRLAKWDHSHAGIATLSFTNVAHEEISRQLEELGCPEVPSYPHFLGTIDSFINTWVFLPFGHLVMKCKARPSIVGMDSNPWHPIGWKWRWRKRACYKNGCILTDFSYDIDGNLINVRGERRDCPYNKRHCAELKARFVREGYATQDDANYWAMKILDTYPRLAKALVKRFPEMIIDEAQDTSDIQMRIVDLLVKNGLSEMMLVGDPDQAIYEWRDANPNVFVSKTKAKEWKEPLRLTENHRSSQRICNATIGFSKHLLKPAKAVGRDADFEVDPVIIQYDFDNLDSIPNEFTNRCRQHGLVPHPETSAILVRTRRILRKILDIQKIETPWKPDYPVTRLLAKAAYCYHQNQQPKRAVAYMRGAMSRICFDNRNRTKLEIDRGVKATMGDRDWRIGLWQLLKSLPAADLGLSDWLDLTETQLKRWFKENRWPLDTQDSLDLARGVKEWTKNRSVEFLEWPLRSFFIEPSCRQDEVTVETIHAAKGKTYEAVLFVVSDSQSRKGTAKQLAELPSGHEEIRTAYVAMTRPRKFLMVAIPKGTDRRLLHRFPKWMKTGVPGQLSLSI